MSSNNVPIIIIWWSYKRKLFKVIELGSHSSYCSTSFQSSSIPCFRYFLQQCSIKVRVREAVSRNIPLTCRVPQGSFLSKYYSQFTVGTKYRKASVMACAIYSRSIEAERAQRQAEEACEKITKKLEGINITVNHKKTKWIIFSFKKNIPASSTSSCHSWKTPDAGLALQKENKSVRSRLDRISINVS